MSLFGALNSGISGMLAQSYVMGTIGDNVANSSTIGYKEAGVSFETLFGYQANAEYTPGGVQSRVSYGISEQGTLSSTGSVTDLAVKGNGFFVVRGPDGLTALTRAGSFVADSSGDLVNAAGYKLMGYNLTDGSTPTANGTGGLQVVNVSRQQLDAAPSQTGQLLFNVPSNAATGASSTTSLVAYDNLGNQVTLGVSLTKTAPDTWSAQVFGPASPNAPLATETLNYSDATGKLVGVTGGSSSTALTVDLTSVNGRQLTLDVSQSTQLASAFDVTGVAIDGSAPSKLDHVTIGTDGTVTSVYANGVSQATYRVPLADVPSADDLTPLAGNAFQASLGSGSVTIGTATTGSLGQVESGDLENSTVDLATELTSMISAQRSYSADSKIIQASSDLLEVVDRLAG